jgi:alpha-1,2-mannosyltransferase
MTVRTLTLDSPVMAAALLAIGIVATAAAWRDRHPHTTADFTLFYVSAQHSSAEMFAHPPGPPRGNMNPPLFQLMLRPLAALPLATASGLFRLFNVLALCGCIWWLARTADERWSMADYGALLAWAPMASMISLNQLTWILWPPLLWAWSCWRRDRWALGAVGYGLALSLKPFLGVVLLWLLVTGRWRAVIVTGITAAASFGVGLLVYGIDVNLAWLEALGDVTWAYALMNASLQGLLARAMTETAYTWVPLIDAPQLVAPLAAAGGALVVIATLLRTRRQSLDTAWPVLMSGALLASPLGWLYYIWWVVPGTRPSRLLFEAPLLWMPMAITVAVQPGPWVTLTFGSVYFWGLFLFWLNRVALAPARLGVRLAWGPASAGSA